MYQHIVPRFIQRQFSGDGKTVYGLKKIVIKDRIKYEVAYYNISRCMSVIDAYEIDGADKLYLESKLQEIETIYSRKLSNFINKLERKEGIENYKKYVEKYLINTMLLFYFRTNNYTQVEELLKSNKINNLSKKIFKKYKMFVLESRDDEFMLSDNFISVYSKYKDKNIDEIIGLDNVTILIPISSKYYLMFTDTLRRKEEVIKVYKNSKYRFSDISFYNLIIQKNASVFLVGKYKYMFIKLRKEICEKENNTFK